MSTRTAIEWTDVTWQTITAAKRIGVAVDEYVSKRASGEKWCTACKAWHPIAAFRSDKSRADGLASSCRDGRLAQYRRTYEPTPPLLKRPMGPPAYEPRDNDKRQARRRINVLVRTGRLPGPATLPCADCGHIGFGKRHEYDHFMGYAASHHLHVQAVCSACHHARERARASGQKAAA
jgi:hypothetical protein